MPTENRSSNTEMASELLPCPFCGQQDFLIERLDTDASVVICQGLTGPHEACLARGPVGVAQHEGEEQPGREKAVELWNTRAKQHQCEPIMLTAVATLVDNGDVGLEPSWLLEGGTAELFAGMTLLVAENVPELCHEDGSAEVYTRADPNVRWKAVADEQISVIERLTRNCLHARGRLRPAREHLYSNAVTPTSTYAAATRRSGPASVKGRAR